MDILQLVKRYSLRRIILNVFKILVFALLGVICWISNYLLWFKLLFLILFILYAYSKLKNILYYFNLAAFPEVVLLKLGKQMGQIKTYFNSELNNHMLLCSLKICSFIIITENVIFSFGEIGNLYHSKDEFKVCLTQNIYWAYQQSITTRFYGIIPFHKNLFLMLWYGNNENICLNLRNEAIHKYLVALKVRFPKVIIGYNPDYEKLNREKKLKFYVTS